jgi:hypothetical protein
MTFQPAEVTKLAILPHVEKRPLRTHQDLIAVPNLIKTWSSNPAFVPTED